MHQIDVMELPHCCNMFSSTITAARVMAMNHAYRFPAARVLCSWIPPDARNALCKLAKGEKGERHLAILQGRRTECSSTVRAGLACSSASFSSGVAVALQVSRKIVRKLEGPKDCSMARQAGCKAFIRPPCAKGTTRRFEQPRRKVYYFHH